MPNLFEEQANQWIEEDDKATQEALENNIFLSIEFEEE